MKKFFIQGMLTAFGMAVANEIIAIAKEEKLDVKMRLAAHKGIAKVKKFFKKKEKELA